MAATEIKAILRQVRTVLLEAKAKFWSDDELTDIFWLGADDLWGAILDLHEDHYFVVDDTHPVLKANASQISGVPDNCFRVRLIEPRDTTETGSSRGIIFTPRKYNHVDFINARTRSAIDPSGVDEIFYQLTGAGSPVNPPTILTAPNVSTAMNLRIAYAPSLQHGEVNPVPGQSDAALKAWVIAFAIGKDKEDRQPDAGWLSTYSTHKQSLLTRLTPRQEQEPEVVDDFFRGYGG